MLLTLYGSALEILVLITYSQMPLITSMLTYSLAGADPGFLEKEFMCIKVWGFTLLILSHFSKNSP